MKNVGFSSSTRATEPQVPEGIVRYALKSLKACLVLPLGNEEIKGGIK